MELKDKQVLVLGLGETGLSLAKWLGREGARLRVADSRAEPPCAGALRRTLPAAELVTGPLHAGLADGAALVAISPGLSRAQAPAAAALARGVPVVGDIELFAQALARNAARPRVLAVTGTNGKTTVTALAGALCRGAGLDTEVAGNIGPAALDALLACEQAGRRPQAWVLELSSFQLESTFSLEPAAAVVLNLSEDHFDRYSGMDEYAAAKQRIFRGCRAQVLNRDDARVMAMAQAGCEQWSFGLGAPDGPRAFGLAREGGVAWLAQGKERLLPLAELPLAGLHNAANALAALALCRAIGLPAEPLVAALRGFRGLPHRVERVAVVEGVVFYDDSKGTNVGATAAALAGLPERAVLIAGGDGKGQDFAPLREPVAQRARAVVLIGRDAPRIEAALAGCGVPLLYAPTLEAAVQSAYALAQPGEAVLLSPACASFDMFRNYLHRAEVFVQAVKGLGGGRH